MTRFPLCSLAISLAAAACGQPTPPLTDAQRVSLEIAVYRALLGQDGAAGALQLSPTPDRPRSCGPQNQGEPCWTDRVPHRFATALVDYLAINDTSRQLDPAVLEEFQSEGADSGRGLGLDPCQSPNEASLSRVGFDPTGRYAIVTMSRRVGQGPYPDCGYLSSGMYLLTRDDAGTWSVDDTIGQIVT